ncbi:MAG: hypothetical protein DRG30_06140 [Epsilonproteobacteria bacterium]|nr:MAG: hypothetical protein DRG30_06140 [Campylobacterota bacterium]
MAKVNPFTIFIADKKIAKIKALGGAEIVYRDLTMQENDAFSKRLVKSYSDGKPEIDFDAASEIKYEKSAMILIDPEMTVEELKALPASAVSAINEINALLDVPTEDDEEGNG